MSKTKMNKAINEAKKATEANIRDEFAKDDENQAFYDFLTNQSGDEDKTQIKLFNDTFNYLNVFNDKALNTMTSDSLINDMYGNTETELIKKLKEFKLDKFANPLKAYLKILKDLTMSIRDIKAANNTVETTIYVCEGEGTCKKYNPSDGEELPDVFTACAIQVSKKKGPTLRCKRKKSIKAVQKKDENEGSWGNMFGFSGGRRKRTTNKKRRKRKTNL